MSASQKVVRGDKGAAVGPVPSVPKEGERFTARELASRFGVCGQGDMRVNHAGKCIVIIDQGAAISMERAAAALHLSA